MCSYVIAKPKLGISCLLTQCLVPPVSFNPVAVKTWNGMVSSWPFTVNVPFLPDDPELWDLPLEATDLSVTNHSTAAGPAQHPGTPCRQYDMMTRSRTPQKINNQRPCAKPALQHPSTSPRPHISGKFKRWRSKCRQQQKLGNIGWWFVNNGASMYIYFSLAHSNCKSSTLPLNLAVPSNERLKDFLLLFWCFRSQSLLQDFGNLRRSKGVLRCSSKFRLCKLFGEMVSWRERTNVGNISVVSETCKESSPTYNCFLF